MSKTDELAPGTLFAGEYRVVSTLGEGGMGTLYVVEQLSTEKRRALKVLRPELAERPSFRRRFQLEAKISARIKSDHVVEVIAAGFDEPSSSLWIVMELLEGEDLGARLKRGPLSLADTVEVLDQLCHALGQAHAQQIVHRDLKPENVFLATARRRGVPFTVKVLDFGIARVLKAAQAEASGTTGAALGTPLWMAPEQGHPGETSPAIDVWALGLIAFYCLTGKFFWKAAYIEKGSLFALATETFGSPIPAASERAHEYGVADAIPSGFDPWFARCVARKNAERYPNAGEAIARLHAELLGPRPTEAAPSAGRASNAPASRTHTAWFKEPIVLYAIVGAVALAFAVVITIAAIHLGRRHPPSAAPARRSGWAAECDEFLRFTECTLKTKDAAARERVMGPLRDDLKHALAAYTPEAQAARCRKMLADAKETPQGRPCVR
jgi:serine/threonine-protein kinase